MKKENLSHDAAKAMLEENDRQRADYYNEHTGKVWGDVTNYHMILDTTALGIENCADILIRYFSLIFTCSIIVILSFLSQKSLALNNIYDCLILTQELFTNNDYN